MAEGVAEAAEEVKVRILLRQRVLVQVGHYHLHSIRQFCFHIAPLLLLLNLVG